MWLLFNFSKYYSKVKGKFKMKKLAVIGTFVAGVSVGFVTCGVLTVRGVLKSEKLRGAIANVISEKVYEWLDDELDHRHKPRISYTSYYDYRPKSKIPYKSYYTCGDNDCTFRNYVFETSGVAQSILLNMCDIIDEHDYVSVEDFYGLCGEPSHYADSTIGWKSMMDTKVIKKEHGYIIDLPEPESLVEEE